MIASEIESTATKYMKLIGPCSALWLAMRAILIGPPTDLRKSSLPLKILPNPWTVSTVVFQVWFRPLAMACGSEKLDAFGLDGLLERNADFA